MDFDKVFYDTKDFKITNTKLGKGVFGAVFIAERNSDHRQFAAKVLDILTDIDGKDQMMIMRESVILSKLNHHSIIKFYGYSQYNFKGKSKPSYIMELACNQSLRQVLFSERQQHSNKFNNTKKFINIYGIV